MEHIMPPPAGGPGPPAKGGAPAVAVLEDRRTLHAPADAARLPRDLDALLGHLPPHRRHGPAGCVPVLGLAVHSGAVRPGSLFACVPGTRDDGHRWAAAAVRAGASALLVERPLPELAGVPQVEVADVRAALAAAARAFHGYADRRLQVLAVTGTNGKTTTACMLESALAAARRPAALLGTVSYRVGRREVASPLTTPDAAALHAMLREAADEGAAAVVMEASSHALAQRRLEGIEVDTAIFTNLSRDHLDYHGSLMAYFAAKRRPAAPRRTRRSRWCAPTAPPAG
jgi:UDP-N-acetylmuramoyl-L-alanyl-D-glutamate--2,6-diaminopimelate ligase